MHSEQVSSLLQSTLNIYFFKNEGDVLAKYLVKLYLVPPPNWYYTEGGGGICTTRHCKSWRLVSIIRTFFNKVLNELLKTILHNTLTSSRLHMLTLLVSKRKLVLRWWIRETVYLGLLALFLHKIQHPMQSQLAWDLSTMCKCRQLEAAVGLRAWQAQSIFNRTRNNYEI